MKFFSTQLLAIAPANRTVTVPVAVQGVYQNVNYWEDATYTYEVVNNIPNNYGWLSNGSYKFVYYPESGEIKKSPTGAKFTLESGYSTPDKIVIPSSIAQFTSSKITYSAQNIVMYAATDNDGIFRRDSSANTTIVVSDGVTVLRSYVFAKLPKTNTNMRFILPSSLTTIGEGTFLQPEGTPAERGMYHNLIIPDSVTTLGKKPFSGCRCTGWVLPAGISNIRDETFNYNTELESVTFKGNITNIGKNAFRLCNKLTNIVFEGDTAPAAANIDSKAFNFVPAAGLTVFFPGDNSTGYYDTDFRAKFPEGTVFEEVWDSSEA